MSYVPLAIYQPLSKKDLDLLKQDKYDKWQDFFNPSQRTRQAPEVHEVRDVILQSWNRSKQNEELNPMIQGSVKNISDEKLRDSTKENKIFHLAQPLLKQAIQELSFPNHAILFSDSDGIILDCYGNPSTLRQIGNSVNANKGAQWSEHWAGTNAIGISIHEKKPIQVFSSEHFAHSCQEWVCSAAPILDPLTNELLGAINLSTTVNSFHPLSMIKTMELVNQIDKFIFQNYYKARELMQSIYIEAVSKWNNQIVVLCNPKGDILWFNHDSPVDKIASLMPLTIDTNKSSSKKEWEDEVTLYGNQYQARYRKIFWNERFIGLLAIFEKKNKLVNSTNKHNHYAKYSLQSLVGESEAIKNIVYIAEIAATSDSNVLITGESGTGKELVASAIHKASHRADHPFIALNCSAIPKDLLVSELFGYIGGAFTGANPKGSKGKFELANKGTLFLDEIGDMPIESQVQLLRVIQEQEIMRIGDKMRIPIDVRVIAATNKNFAEEIQLGKFREDLYYRLNVIPIELPSLRQRSEDIPLLVEHFIQKLKINKHSGPYHITAEAFEILNNYSWPGNIRELENVIEYAVTFSTNGVIIPENIPENIHPRQSLSPVAKVKNPVDQVELEWILSALKRSQMNVTKAAKELNMNRSTVYRKLKKMGYDIKNH